MAKTKIAIIEDDIAIVQMYRTKFELEGYEVETAGDGASGLKLIQDTKPDIVLLDLMMPGMGGVDMLTNLKKDPATKDIKVIVLTNMGDTETANRVFKLGATDFIVKAEMTPKQVSEKVKKVLEA
jgi:two-component system, OmpR family, phosphate regulon response regulator PhoB